MEIRSLNFNYYINRSKSKKVDFLKEDSIKKLAKTTLLIKYIHVCTSHHQLHMQTLYIIQNELI